MLQAIIIIVIICNRDIHTLHFDRSGSVTKSIVDTIENARKRRGVIVATPTTLKVSIIKKVKLLGGIQ